MKEPITQKPPIQQAPSNNEHPPDFVLKFLRDMPPCQRARARHLVRRLEKISCLNTPKNIASTSPHLSDWPRFKLGDAFTKKAVPTKKSSLNPFQALQKLGDYLNRPK